MANRTEIPFVVEKIESGTGHYIAASGASVHVINRSDSSDATIYSAETGGGTLSNPLVTDGSGNVAGWLAPGRYSLVVSGTGITTYTQPYDSTPALVANATLTYGTTVNTDASLAAHFKITVTNTSDFNIANPTNPTQAPLGRITYDIVNSGGTMGVITWDTAFKLAGTFTNPANTKRRTITFYYDGTNWVEVSRAAADI
jgi:hypothetical protein